MMLKYTAVASVLIPPWVAMILAAYWLLFDDHEIIQVIYEHPRFLTAPAKDRGEAIKLEVSTTTGGSSLYIYREICVRQTPVGTVKSVWESNTFAWAAPERPIPEYLPGCRNESFNVVAPTTSPSRDFIYKPVWWLEVNPLRTQRMELLHLHLHILSPSDAPQTDMVRR